MIKIFLENMFYMEKWVQSRFSKLLMYLGSVLSHIYCMFHLYLQRWLQRFALTVVSGSSILRATGHGPTTPAVMNTPKKEEWFVTL